MDLSPKNEREEIEKFCSKIPVLSEYATVLESHVKLRYVKKISVLGIDPFKIPCEQFNTDWFWFIWLPSSADQLLHKGPV